MDSARQPTQPTARGIWSAATSHRTPKLRSPSTFPDGHVLRAPGQHPGTGYGEFRRPARGRSTGTNRSRRVGAMPKAWRKWWRKLPLQSRNHGRRNYDRSPTPFSPHPARAAVLRRAAEQRRAGGDGGVAGDARDHGGVCEFIRARVAGAGGGAQGRQRVVGGVCFWRELAEAYLTALAHAPEPAEGRRPRRLCRRRICFSE